jgi:diguanylate cyclase (GGDEF)-like protein
VVVLGDEPLGAQVFRLGQKSVTGDSLRSLATAPCVYCEPDIVPDLVRDVVRNVCQLSLTVHLARYGADHDPLTNVANRRNFEAALHAAAVQSSRYGWGFALVLVDLNGIRAVNGRGEHVVSDDLKRHFGRALRRSIRNGDIAGRIGGDSFAVILWNAGGTEVLAFTERLRALLVSVADLDFTFGTAASPSESTDIEELCRIADARLYEKKGVALR